MMKMRTCLLLFVVSAVPCVAQQQSSPGQTSTDQQKRDVPEQRPGTNNPDLSKEHNAPPAATDSSSGSTVKHRKKHHPKAAGTTDTATSPT
jgi:hypothetical protein